jgi:SAM-dependent methyltransferase
MTVLPYDDESFDYVLAWNVIYHGDESVVRKTIEEIRRVLRPGGYYQGTMLSKRNAEYVDRMGEEIAPNTLAGGTTSDKAHPHYYCSAGELTGLFEGFELLSLVDREQKKPGSYHWVMVAEKV